MASASANVETAIISLSFSRLIPWQLQLYPAYLYVYLLTSKLVCLRDYQSSLASTSYANQLLSDND